MSPLSMITVYSYTAKILYRIVKSNIGATRGGAKAASVPRPVVGLYFSLFPEIASHEMGNALPLNLRQEISVRIPSLPLQVPGSTLAISVLDNRNDQLSNVLLLPPLKAGEPAFLDKVESSHGIVLKLVPKTVQRVKDSQGGHDLCESRPGYSKNKVLVIQLINQMICHTSHSTDMREL